MDKLENETWEEYAFRNKLFVIKYADKEQQMIDDITIPIHTNVYQRHTDSNCYHYKVMHSSNNYTDIGFMDFIMHELYNLRDKYNTGLYYNNIKYGILNKEQMTKENEEDFNRQNWLFKQLDYWEKKYEENEREKMERERDKKQKEMDVKNRYFELKAIISGSHKEQLDELIAIVRGSSIQKLEGEIKSNVKDWNDEAKEREKENIQKKKERVELYQKYFKNKDIQSQITELQQKINQLKSEIV